MSPLEERFFVILCSHNGGKFIEDQVESIFASENHSETNIERMYIHDFGSSDDTRIVIERLRERFKPRIEVTLHDDAPGAAASFLRALKTEAARLPSNALLFFCDQDDAWLPNKLEAVRTGIGEHQLMSAEPYVLFHDVRVVDENLNLLRPTFYTGNPYRVPRDLHLTRLLMSNPAIGHTMLISKPLVDLLVAWPNSDIYMMHDWLAILIASRIGRISYIAEPLSLYRQHGSNVLGAYGRRKLSAKRLIRFADQIVRQSVAFSRATATMRVVDGRKPSGAPLERMCRTGYRSAAAALSAAAVLHGPTWQRKAIGLFLLWRALLGPRKANNLR